jgi:uncharacterized protein YecE (DUF72 family)
MDVRILKQKRFGNAMRKKNKGSSFYSGTSGLKLPMPRYLFPDTYKELSRMAYYSVLFNSIEINSSFYKIPLPKTISKWVDSVEENFKFTFKLWKGITHAKGFRFNKKDVDLFLHSIAAAKNKKGALLIQLPPSITAENYPKLVQLLRHIQKTDTLKWNIAVEFRHRSWYDEKVYEMLEQFNASLVIHDIPKSATPMTHHTPEVVYIRFHGPTGNYRDSYSESLLSEYATYINEWLAEGKTVYAYFNNTMGDAVNNLTTLNSMISKKS